METIETVYPVKIDVVPSKTKRGYSLKHNQKHGWKGIITDTWAWYKFKVDAVKAQTDLLIHYNKPSLKKTLVKYLHGKENPVVERFLVENENDIKNLFVNKIIGTHQVQGLNNIIASGEKAIVNEIGGYCPAKGTWEIQEY